MRTGYPIRYLLLLLSLAAYILLHYAYGRHDFDGTPAPSGFAGPASIFAVLFIACGLILLWYQAEKDFVPFLGAAMAFRIALIFCLPNLSDDFYRYVWDGLVFEHQGDPYALSPMQFMAGLGAKEAVIWQPLFDKLNSKGYYSVYPPFTQYIFWLATKISGGDIFGTVVVLKHFVLIAEGFSVWILIKLCAKLGFNKKAVLIYALNPLVIIELSGNLHMEAFMICFLLAAIWLLVVSRIVWTAPALALAIGAKLLPVLIFPFLPLRIGRLATIRLFFLVVLFAALASGPLLSFNNLAHYFESVRLYFNHFEFNAGPYYLLRHFLGDQGFWVNRILPGIVGVGILVMAWKEKSPRWQLWAPSKNEEQGGQYETTQGLSGETDGRSENVWRNLPGMLMLALAVYQLFSPVVHPWYICPIIALAALSPWRFPIAWSVILPFTYFAYWFPGVREQYWLILLEYLLVFAFIALEWASLSNEDGIRGWLMGRDWFRSWMIRTMSARMRIKKDRITRHLDKDGEVLDIGSGHGGLCLELRKAGFNVTALDVRDHSLFAEIKPKLYDGQTIPFAEGRFHTCLMITMLHHCTEPEKVLDEAVRVSSKRLIVMEDVYRNPIQKYLTFFTDSLVNLEFSGHPHTNKPDAEWLRIFQVKGLRVVFREEFRTLLFFRQVVYVLEVDSSINLPQ